YRDVYAWLSGEWPGKQDWRRGPARGAAWSQLLERPIRRIRLILTEGNAARLDNPSVKLFSQDQDTLLDAFQPLVDASLCIAIGQLFRRRSCGPQEHLRP